jgi:hypothetical protein
VGSACFDGGDGKSRRAVQRTSAGGAGAGDLRGGRRAGRCRPLGREACRSLVRRLGRGAWVVRHLRAGGRRLRWSRTPVGVRLQCGDFVR